MAKRVSRRPEWLTTERVVDVYSISGCISNDFTDYIPYWKHNGYWLFDAPAVIREVAGTGSVDLTGTSLFYYEVHPLEFDDADDRWKPFEPERSFTTAVVAPPRKTLEGYDVVTFSVRTRAECSPLSCNRLAAELETNEHCLLPSADRARELLEAGRFANTEPGPFRIFAVYSLDWP